MLRTAVVVSLGLGLVGSPHVAGLVVVAVVLTALLAGVPEWWRPRKPARALGLEIRPQRSHHFHYCDTCDEQWAHPGESTACIVHWASRCARCDGTGAPPRDRRTA